MERGHVNIGIPIDIPFTEITRLMEAQLVGKTFPLDRGSPFTATVRGVNVAASGGRLLISMRVKANENKTWFGLGARRPSTSGGGRRSNCREQTLEVDDISAGRSIGGGLWRSRRGGACGAALRGEGTGGERVDRSQADRRERPQEHRGDDCRLPEQDQRRDGGRPTSPTSGSRPLSSTRRPCA